MQRVLAIWLPNWPLQRLVRKQPELRGRPVALKCRGSRGECVAACSAEAIERGIEVGMPIAEALALGKKIKGWHQQEHDPVADRTALKQLAAWCHRFSPLVGIEDAQTLTPAWPETLWLDATNLAPLYGSEVQLVEQVASHFVRLKLDARLALADNLGTAWAASHYGSWENEAGCIVPPDRGVDLLASLPIEALRLADATTEMLHRLGVYEIQDLLALPRDQLCSRFGPLLLRRVDQALGQVEEAFEAAPPPTEFTASEQLEHPLAKREAVEHVAGQLIQRTAHLLAAHNAGALQLTCRFECQTGPPAVLEAGLFRPSCHAGHLLELVQMQLERVLLPGAVTGVQVRVVRHGPLERRQKVLFEAESPLENSRELAALVDRLAGRLGRQSVVRCRLVHEAQPELAYRELPLVGNPSLNKSPAGKRAGGRTPRTELGPLDRPLHVFERPLAIDALGVAGEGPPQQFFYRGNRHDAARHWGPERIETGWWRRRAVSRDYYRIETTTGQRFWLYRCLRSERWFLHGMFD